MKNFLFFLLGFVLSIALVCGTSHAAPQTFKYNGICYAWAVTPPACGYDKNNRVTYTLNLNGTITGTAAGDGDYCYQTTYLLKIEDGSWSQSPANTFNTSGPPAGVQALIDQAGTPYGTIAEITASLPKTCTSDCVDTDHDGLCDVCDDVPNDSTVGATKYIKGYLQTKNGDVVATYLSHSATSEKYDILAIDPQYNYPEKFPGLVYVIGMPSYIDEKAFQKGGGTIAYLAKPKAWRKYKCNAVESLDQCTKAVCSYDKENGATEADNKLKDTLDGGVKNLSTADQKAADAPYMDLDKNCDQLRSQCNKSCGAATNVKSFGCSENKHMVCECLNDGKWELAETWNDLGTTINQSETTTNNYYGDGDSTTGGGGVTGVSGDGTSGFTGSYEYVEGSYDYDSFGSHYAKLANKFPFSLRTTIGSIYSDFKGSGSAPVYSYNIYGHSVAIELSSFDDIAKMIRSIFALGVTLSTILMLIYLYVGIDLRGK